MAHRRARRVDTGHPGEDRDGLRREGLRPARAHRDRGVGVRVQFALWIDPRQRGLLLSRGPRRSGSARPAGRAGRAGLHEPLSQGDAAPSLPHARRRPGRRPSLPLRTHAGRVRGRCAGAARRYEEDPRRDRLSAPRGRAGAAPRRRGRVPDRLPAPRGARRHLDPHRSLAGPRAGRTGRPSGEAGRRSAHGPRHPRHRRDRGGRVASALGPQGPARPRRPDGGAVLKAALFREHGGAEKILYEDYRDPVVSPAEVLVRVKACALNHVDMLLLDGRFPPPEGLPHVNGCEVTGTIEAVGAGVTGWERGQRVIIFPGFACGSCEYCLRGERTVCVRYGYLGAHKDGGYAELVRAPAANLLPLPAAVSFEAGAAVPLAMLTSWHALVAQAEVRPGQTVLVQAAGSGVGSAAIQIARLCGARVITTVGADDKIEFAKSLGAERVVNYRTQDFVEETKTWTGKRGVDVVVEHIGGDTFEQSVYALTRLGTLVTIGSHDTHWGRLDLRHVYSRNLRILGTNLGSIVELKTVLDHIVQGRLRPVVDRAFPLKDARAAVQHVLDRKNKGKVLLVS